MQMLAELSHRNNQTVIDNNDSFQMYSYPLYIPKKLSMYNTH